MAKRIKMFSDSHLHSDDSVNEEQHDDKQSNVRQCLEGLNESPQKCSNTFASTEKLHQSHHAKESKEVYRDYARRFLDADASVFRLINFGVHNVNETSKHDDEVKNIPSISEIIFKSKRSQLEYKFQRENCRENHVKYVECFGVKVGLSVELHRERDCVDHNQYENCILERL